jgi:beta-glucosidase
MLPRCLHPLALAFGVTVAVRAAPPSADNFIKPPAPSFVAIYRDGWIDLNKNDAKDPYEDAALPVDTRIDDLLGRMTMEEKTAQMVTLYGFPRVVKDELPTDAWATAFWKDGIGNIDEHMNGNTGWKGDLADPVHDLPWSLHARAINEVQRWFIERTRLGIPVDFTDEGIRGLLHSKATSFPAQLGVAAAFDRDLVRTIGRVTGREARALGFTNIYSPILDLARDPRWGRTTETYGEDPFLVGELGVEQVRGIQEQGAASTLKHYAVYSVPSGGRDGGDRDGRSDPQVTWRDVQTIFLHPFRRAVRDAGALGVMASYNDYDGIPIQGSSLFLTDILRREWGFQGYVVSDSRAVERIHTLHHVAPTAADAVRQSVEAGLNIRTNFTKPEEYGDLLRQNVREGKLAPEVIDARVRDILRVKYRLGLFDRPYVADPAAADRIVRAPEHMAAAARAARASLVLLKNAASTLPLDRARLKKVLVTGPMADDAHGWWSRYAPQRLEFVTPLAGLRAKLGSGVEVRYVKGCDLTDANFPESDLFKEPMPEATRSGIVAAVAAAQDVDVIVAVLGENETVSQEGYSRVSLDLPGYQEDLLRALHATGKPVVLVLTNGRPLSVNWAAKHVPAIVEMWFPGEEGGAALADVLLGDYNPGGRLPITFPRSAGQVPYNFPAHPGSQPTDHGQVSGPLFPFGHGLSYTTFAYANLSVTPAKTTAGSAITVSCDLTNTGARAGDEVAQLYVRDDYSSVTTFYRVLRGFTRVTLAPGETKRVTFTLTPEHLQLYNRENRWAVEPGRFTVWVGASSADLRLRGEFTVTGADGSVPHEAPIPDAKP